MNVVLPKLLPQEYGGANSLKTQVELALRYSRLNPNGEGAAAVARYLSEVGSAALLPTQAIVSDGAEYTDDAEGITVTVHVTDGVVTVTTAV